MRKAIAILIGSTSLIFALHNGLYAQIPEAIGTITFMEGISDIVRNNQEPLFVNEHQPIYVNDRIRTKSYSKMEITFADKSVLRLAPGTCVSIEEYRLNDKKIRELAHIILTRGKIETIVSKTGAPDTFLIDTPNAKGAVKGSDIFISYLGGRTGVFAQEGAISVLNPSSPDMKTRVTKGNCVFIPFNEVPGEMRLVRDSEITYFKRSVEPEFIKKWIPSKGSTQMNAVLVSISGDVRFYRKGASDWREAKMNETLSEGDKIQTGDDGMAQIRLSNGNSIMLQRNAELGFATLRYDQASGNYQNTFEMTKGKLSAVVENINKQCTFQVKTPASVCGVRGTFLEVITAPAAAAAQPTTQAFFEGGSGYVTSTTTGQTQEVGPGQNASVDESGNVSTPAYTTAEQRTEMFQTWSVAQTVGGYSTIEGATGVGGGSTIEQPLPPGPEPLDGGTLGGNNPPPTPPDLPFVEVLPPDIDPTVYSARLNVTAGSGIDSVYMDLVAKQSGIWFGAVGGIFDNGGPENSFPIIFSNDKSDSITINVVGDSGSGTSGTWSVTPEVVGIAYGKDPDIIVTLTSGSGTYTGDGNSGTFSGTLTGTWTQ